MTNEERYEFLRMQQENLALKHRMVSSEMEGVSKLIAAERTEAVAKQEAAEKEALEPPTLEAVGG